VERRFYNDGFSRNAAKFKDGTYKYRAVVPNILFFEPTHGLLSIFNKYVFTIEENTPQDVQVALDPELLGKVFENLLGAYNPETQETARNQSGSFYTPREIVQYMVNESLVAHLKRTVGEELEPQYRQLMDFSEMHVELSEKQKHDILHSLFTCKILDPACGSGAFPMGMLQQMVHILRQVDPDNTQWKLQAPSSGRYAGRSFVRDCV
ncbi:MAG: SAM-dependent DNA methyltransferase, partial [Oscillospiraceae bacterium]|nr:SAM-dependent DNA methyltransferase [Oscillospiraceae bacterium]